MSENGKLPPSELAPIAQGRLAIKAAAAWNAMNAEARRKGVELLPTGSMSSYRTYAQQRYLYAEYQAGRGSLAAIPGQSNHGWGLAVDVATIQMRQTIDQIGAKYGWAKRCSDAQSEWWHLKFDPVCIGATWHGADPGPYGKTQAPAPGPEQIAAVACARSNSGVLHVFYENRDGSVWYAYQRPFETKWSELKPFAPAPR
jgi:hypothetical protein